MRPRTFPELSNSAVFNCASRLSGIRSAARTSLVVGALTVAGVHVRIAQLEPGFTEFRIDSDRVAVLDHRFPRISGGRLVVSALDIFAFDDLRIFRACDYQRQHGRHEHCSHDLYPQHSLNLLRPQNLRAVFRPLDFQAYPFPIYDGNTPLSDGNRP